MPPKAKPTQSQDTSTSKQQTLFSFFKQPPSTSSPSTTTAPLPLSSSAARNELAPTSSDTAVGSSAVKKNGKGRTGQPKLAATSEADIEMNGDLEDEEDDEPPAPSSSTSVSNPFSSSISSTHSRLTSHPRAQLIPSKRHASSVLPTSNSDSDSDQVTLPNKKRLATTKTKVVDSDSDDDDVKIVSPVKKVKAMNGKGKKANGKKANTTDDDDDFEGSAASGSGSAAESEDFFDDDLDDFIANDPSLSDPPPTNTKPKPKPKAKPEPKAVRPPPKPFAGGSGSGTGTGTGSGTGSIKTQAEMQKAKEKEKKQANEQVYDFLVDPKDADGVRPGEEGYDPRTLFIPKKAWGSFTPFETQFWEIKQNHYDTVLFFQKGKFFELYEEDA
ncbi:hypothetical protein P7C70_g9024, partial [Phenoliferia sp. Uapishka_3]